MNFEKFKSVAYNLTGVTISKASKQADIAKNTVKKLKLESNISDKYEEIGKICYELVKNGEFENEKIEKLCAKIDDINEKIEEIEEETKEYKKARDAIKYSIDFDDDSIDITKED